MRPFALFAAFPLIAASPGTVAAMKWERRVLLVAAPSAKDPALVAQRNIIARWKAEAAARDLTLVEVAGGTVTGAGDSADTLRRRYKLPADRSTIILIGKDGGEKMRSATPLSAKTLQDVIDAMPMRRAGQR